MGRHTLAAHPTHLTGTSNEYYAAAMYLARGQHVFWPADQHSPVDFIIKSEGSFLEVQVKTARNSQGYWKTDTVSSTARLTKGSKYYDLLTVISPEGDVWEIPSSVIRSDSIILGRVDGKGRANKWEKYRTRNGK